MKPENAIEVHNISKCYKVFYDKGSQLKEKLLFRSRNRYEKRQVLDDISFEVKKGEAIGLIGHNGCGKSTTLKLLTRIIYPDKGTIEMRGRVSSLIELGAGFHADMSGRENIYTNAAIFGLSRKEINARIDDIIKFSELEAYIDNPVRTYSSGMYMRLAFSIAINVDADILLIDEILAVGDAGFQAKCFEKLKEIKKKGTTIIIVSHALESIEAMCEKSFWIENGKIREVGKPKDVHRRYLAEMEEKRLARKAKEQGWDMNEGLPSFCAKHALREGNRKVEFTNVELLNDAGEKCYAFPCLSNMTVKMYYHRNVDKIDSVFGIGIFREDGVHCYGTNFLIENKRMVETKEDGVIEVNITGNALLPGASTLDIAAHAEDGTQYDDIRKVLHFEITSTGKIDIGVCRLESEWKELGGV